MLASVAGESAGRVLGPARSAAVRVRTSPLATRRTDLGRSFMEYRRDRIAKRRRRNRRVPPPTTAGGPSSIDGATGIEAAAWRFFGRPASALSAGEATLLAVLPRSPTAYDPRRHLDRALRRRAHVLELMQRRGWLDPAQRARILAQPIVLARSGPPAPTAPHFTEWAIEREAVERPRRTGPACAPRWTWPCSSGWNGW